MVAIGVGAVIVVKVVTTTSGCKPMIGIDAEYIAFTGLA